MVGEDMAIRFPGIGFGFAGAVALTLSTFITSSLLLYSWSWLSPVDFWQKLVAIVFTVIVGVILFLALSVVIMMVLMPFTFRKKKRKKGLIYVEGYE